MGLFGSKMSERALSKDQAKALKGIIEMLAENRKAVEALSSQVAEVRKEVGTLRKELSLLPGMEEVAGRLNDIRAEVEGLRDGVASTALVTSLLNKLAENDPH